MKKATKLGFVLGTGAGALGAFVLSSYFEKANVSSSEAMDSCDIDNKKFERAIVKNVTATNEWRLNEAIVKSRKLCQRLRDEGGIPGVAVNVSVNGKSVWSEGFGYADIENRVKMRPEAVFRIASISKSMTMAMLAKFMEQGKVDIDCPIQKYLENFPQKEVDGKKVVITTRHLLSHLSGIRHYTKKEDLEKSKEEREMELKEYYIKDKFDSVTKSMELFQNDTLLHPPGTKYYYTTHGWTVVSAIIEKLADENFEKHAKKMFDYWGLKCTKLDQNDPIIYNRIRYYSRDKEGKLINSPYVDNSYKWAGGGFLSTVKDLTQFAHILLYSYQYDENKKKNSDLPKLPFINKTTIDELWQGVAERNEDWPYGLGFVIGDVMRKCAFCKERELMTVFHTGAAIGSTSMLMLTFPKNINKDENKGYDTVDKLCTKKSCDESELSDVKGVVVAMFSNLTDASVSKEAFEISKLFQEFM